VRLCIDKYSVSRTGVRRADKPELDSSIGKGSIPRPHYNRGTQAQILCVPQFPMVRWLTSSSLCDSAVLLAYLLPVVDLALSRVSRPLLFFFYLVAWQELHWGKLRDRYMSVSSKLDPSCMPSGSHSERLGAICRRSLGLGEEKEEAAAVVRGPPRIKG
jgi:hypothetical protein